MPAGPISRPRSPSGIGTVLNSTTSTGRSLRPAVLLISGASPDNNLVEIVEIEDHPWFLGCQFHPEFKSKPMKPHPLFRDFISAALHMKQNG